MISELQITRGQPRTWLNLLALSLSLSSLLFTPPWIHPPLFSLFSSLDLILSYPLFLPFSLYFSLSFFSFFFFLFLSFSFFFSLSLFSLSSISLSLFSPPLSLLLSFFRLPSYSFYPILFSHCLSCLPGPALVQPPVFFLPSNLLRPLPGLLIAHQPRHRNYNNNNDKVGNKRMGNNERTAEYGALTRVEDESKWDDDTGLLVEEGGLSATREPLSVRLYSLEEFLQYVEPTSLIRLSLLKATLFSTYMKKMKK